MRQAHMVGTPRSCSVGDTGWGKEGPGGQRRPSINLRHLWWPSILKDWILLFPSASQLTQRGASPRVFMHERVFLSF
jgi:hypothetical protein